MFCEKCGREIPEDSLYCNYCGVIVPPEQRELDWEEAARLRERLEGQGRPGSAAKGGGRKDAYDPGCVTPGAAKKKCGVCGRELPASALEPLCALCTMRRKQEEEAQADQRAQEERQRAIAAGEQDRYDISDEYDWRTLEREPSSAWQAAKREKGGRKPQKKIAAGIAVAAGLFFLCVIMPNIIQEAENAYYQRTSDVVSVPAEEAFPEVDWEAEEPVEAIGYEDFLSDGYAPPWELPGAWTVVHDGESFDAWVLPMAQWTLENCLPLLSDTYADPFISEDVWWYTDGVRNRVNGRALYIDETGETVTVPFDMVLLLSGDEPGGPGYVLCFQADGQLLFDDLDAVDQEGRVTEEGLDMFEGCEVGDYPFDGAKPMDFSR